MAANQAGPILIVTPRSPGVRIATANTNRDGATGVYGTLFTAGAAGSFGKGIRFCAEGTVTAGFVRVFKQDAGAGNVEMIAEIPVPATTPSAGVTPAWQYDWLPPGGLMMSAGTVIKVSTNNAETFGAHGIDFGDF